ncbi:hypothetical protein BWI93_04040 [Siphonobacter sp. BAB-5385]|uniref:DUF2911 domain-containing protein n=1 Tax=unclassified Siphonobacter TaxID=2635712 RepID=UPI000B9EAEAF|nr:MULTISPECIES: DUF2911 domain-containing protein [unclassified Siphonobacter]OZI09421.1 hypothetical protein BWI93_04040 [Siphonobacter sp. BAB-5385]PMD92067.1 hypothetical protein BWI97_21070 [Siphonobacter sp. BAB-5405]
MKKALLTFFVAFFALTSLVFAQNQPQDKSKRPSPPAQAMGKVNGKTITIDYSQPSVKGRDVWKEEKIAPYGKVWRTGANEATIFETSGDLKVEGKALPAGKYSLFTIPGEKEWTIIFNKTAEQWGAYNYKEADDALRVKVPARKAPQMTEKFTIKVANSGTVSMSWADTMVDFKVK